MTASMSCAKCWLRQQTEQKQRPLLKNCVPLCMSSQNGSEKDSPLPSLKGAAFAITHRPALSILKRVLLFVHVGFSDQAKRVPVSAGIPDPRESQKVVCKRLILLGQK